MIGRVNQQPDTYDASPSSVRPLLDTFWSSAGWREPRNWPTEADMAAAVKRGVMFPAPLTYDHDGWVEAARSAAYQTSAGEVEDAFLVSLTSRRLDLRSALSSYVLARALPEHPYTAMRGSGQCAVCGLYAQAAAQDLNVLNFERFKWGGVRRDDLTYVVFDLQQFRRAPRLKVTAEDVALARAVLKTLSELPATTTAVEAVAHLKMLKGNKAEREVLMDMLGICSILDTGEHHGYAHGFVSAVQRDLPPYHFVDRAYPTCWWRAAAGINLEAVSDVLPRLA